jgi:hypothetical protein
MANFHSDEWVYTQIARHHDFAETLYKPEQIVGIFCQGSTNYGLDTKDSDIDTKCIVVPTFKEIALARKPVSTTHVLPNDEHCDGKDIRLYMEIFRKQNLNFLEILFTPYYSINSAYYDEWMRLIEAREAIARMNPYRAVKSMKGIAMEKFHAMEHRYPTKADIIDKYGHDGKQTSHLLRVDDYLTRYIAGESYESCLRPTEDLVPRILAYKNQEIPLEEAREEAAVVLAHTVEIADEFCAKHEDCENSEMRELLEDVSYKIMRIAALKELGV